MTVYTKSYAAPAVNEKEILRYAGVVTPTEEISKLLAGYIFNISMLGMT